MNARSDAFPFGEDAERLSGSEAERLMARIGDALRDRPPEPEPPEPPDIDIAAAMAAIARAMAKKR